MSTAIFEMAFEKKTALVKTENLQMQIADHLVKVHMYNESTFVRHWTKEVNAWLLTIQNYKLKRTNRPLQKNELFRILWADPLGSINDVASRMKRNYREYPDLHIDQPDAAEIHKNLRWLLEAVCQDISEDEFYDIKDYK
jgi:hypothetical protein